MHMSMVLHNVAGATKPRISKILNVQESQKHGGFNTIMNGTAFYCISCYFREGFIFREFREPDPRENFHFNSCLFIVMTTSEKSRN